MSDIVDGMTMFDDIDANERWMLSQLRDLAMSMPTPTETFADVQERNKPDDNG
jgi:hypothetical protein